MTEIATIISADRDAVDDVFDALSHSGRREILLSLADGCERSDDVLARAVHRPTSSIHQDLATLRCAGLVRTTVDAAGRTSASIDGERLVSILGGWAQQFATVCGERLGTD